ncbi:MAG: hypothetical protein CL790_07285 [Chloroflexi bacterium]|nr:hypothetical protein [Chloroflexota bacterium]|tara:strand:+ start:4867 stop:6597 length:1731 start_codon:yes stop_codon:yes gene_type:complete
MKLEVSERAVAVEVGVHTRVGIYVPTSDDYRFFALGSAPSSLEAPDFDLTIGYKAAVSEAVTNAGSYAFNTTTVDKGLVSDGLPISVVTGEALARGPTAFLMGNLVARDLEALASNVALAGFEEVGRATTSVRDLRERVDGPAAIDVIASHKPDLVVASLTSDSEGDGIEYLADLMVMGLAGRESHYVPRILLLYGGDVPTAVLNRLKLVFPTRVIRISGGTPNQPMDLHAPTTALEEEAKNLCQNIFKGNVIPTSLATSPHRSRAVGLGAATDQLAKSQGLDVTVLACDYSDVTVVVARGGITKLAQFAAGNSDHRPFHLGFHTPVDRVARWIPDGLLPQAMHSYVINQTSHPTAIPSTTSELMLSHAVWTVGARGALTNSDDGSRLIKDGSVDLAVLTGEVTKYIGRPIQAALLMINSLETWGITQLAFDSASALAMSGCLLETGIPVSIESSLIHLGSCVAVRGQASVGETAVAVEVQPDGFPAIEREVGAGSMDVIQWEAGVDAEIRIWPSGKFDVGLGYGRPIRVRSKLVPGSVGLVIDARGRPLEWPEDSDERKARIEQWYRSLNAYASA